MPTCTRRFTIDAGHRVLGHTGRCRHIHGHRYEIEVTAESRGLDPLGMVVDFSVIKDKVGSWLNENLDHNLILHQDDPLLALADARQTDDPGGPEDGLGMWRKVDGPFGGRYPHVMPSGWNPTAENLAVHIRQKADGLLQPLGLRVTHVRVHETENCYADSYLRENP